MGLLKVFSIYDSKAEAFHRPFLMPTNGQAVRAFTEVANDPQGEICKFPGDFSLFEIGSFDELKGELMPLKAKVNLGTALEFKKPSQAEMSAVFGGKQ